MSPSPEPLFPPRGERGYDAAGVETFPWPVVAGYEDVHRWMDQGQAVHAVWQLKDVWEGLLKFLATLAVADHLTAAPAEDARTGKLLAKLLKPNGLTLGEWANLLEVALKEGPLPTAGLPQLSPLLFPGGKPGPLVLLVKGDKPRGDREGFIDWRNSCFGHGVFRKDVGSYADDALRWLTRLHEAFDICRPLLESLALESEGPDGAILTWGQQLPLPFYHGHEPAAVGPVLPPVRVRPRLPGSAAILLTPLLSVQLCTVCGQWAAFYLDRYDRGRHRAKFLDFVEGHCNERDNLKQLIDWTERVRPADAQAAAARQPDPGERREPDPERFRDFQHEFEPPAYLARQVADFLRTHDRGVLVLTGPGGVGKSWATQGLDHTGMLPAALGRAVPLLDVSMHGPTAPLASEVRTALTERARRGKRWQVPAWPDGPEPHTRFAAWLAALMRANGLGELLVTLDGLDDLPADSDVPDLWPPAGALPPGCYLVLSSRPRVRAAAEGGLRRVRSVPDHFCELRVGPDEPEHRAVLRSYVAKRLARLRPDGQGALPAAWADPLIDQAGGCFLYVFHYCRALHFGVYTDLAQLPPPAAYYPAFFEHLRGRVGNELFHGHYAQALALIAVAREPVGLTHLEKWGLKRSSLIDILVDLADLLHTRRETWDDETMYSLGHDTVRQFLTEDKAWQSRLAAADRRLAELAVRWFGNDWSAVDPFHPVESYLLFHLLDHATEPELRARLLADTALADACEKHGYTLWSKREFALCLLPTGMALRLREDQVQRQGRRELRHDLARAHMNRGTALSSLCRSEEALADDGAAVELFGTLVNREGRHELRDYLAMAYMNQGIALWALGRLEEALTDHGASIGIYGELVHEEGRRELRHDLAGAYMHRGNTLRDLGRAEEALADFNTAIGLGEELVHRESRQELRNDLAKAQMNRGNALGELGRLDEALADLGASINLREELVRREGRRELRNDLAMAYTNRGVALTNLGRLEEALADQGASIGLYRELVHGEGRRELRHHLAKAYCNRGGALEDLGRLEEALADFGASIDLREELVRREGRRELRAALAPAHMHRGVLLWELGCLAEALADHTAAIGLFEELVRREGRLGLRNNLAGAYMNRGAALGLLSRPEEALADHTAAIGLFEELVQSEGRLGLRNNLARAYNNRGITLRDLGRPEEALADYGTCIELEEELVHREGRHESRKDLAAVYMNRGIALVELDRREEALADYGAAIKLYEELVRHHGRRELRNELARVYLNRGNYLGQLGRLQEALADYGTSIGLREDLVHREDHRELVGDLARAYVGHAALLLQMGGRREEACLRAREAVAILQREVTRTGRADLRRGLEIAEEVVRNACG